MNSHPQARFLGCSFIDSFYDQPKIDIPSYLNTYLWPCFHKDHEILETKHQYLSRFNGFAQLKHNEADKPHYLCKSIWPCMCSSASRSKLSCSHDRHASISTSMHGWMVSHWPRYIQIDHFPDSPRYEPHTTDTFKQRYFYDSTYYQSGGPVFLYISGETSGTNRFLFLRTGSMIHANTIVGWICANCVKSFKS